MSGKFGLQYFFLFITLVAISIGLAAHGSSCLFTFGAILLAPLALIRWYSEEALPGVVTILFLVWMLVASVAIAFFSVCSRFH